MSSSHKDFEIVRSAEAKEAASSALYAGGRSDRPQSLKVDQPPGGKQNYAFGECCGDQRARMGC